MLDDHQPCIFGRGSMTTNQAMIVNAGHLIPGLDRCQPNPTVVHIQLPVKWRFEKLEFQLPGAIVPNHVQEFWPNFNGKFALKIRNINTSN